MNVKIKIPTVNKSHNELPIPATSKAAGIDLRASLFVPIGKYVEYLGEKFEVVVDEKGFVTITLHPEGRILIPTDLYIAIPDGYELQIRPRSGLAIKHGIGVLNSPGTIDADYRGNVGVILINNGSKSFTINNNDRIAQAVLNKFEYVEFVEVDSLDETERGEGGFGHTGV